MADYKEKFEEWQQAARRKARELDEKYAISDLVEEGARAAGEAAKRGAETIRSLSPSPSTSPLPARAKPNCSPFCELGFARIKLPAAVKVGP